VNDISANELNYIKIFPPNKLSGLKLLTGCPKRVENLPDSILENRQN